MRKLMISEVQIIPIKPHDGLLAFASLVLNEQFYLGSIGIHSRLDGSGYRITYPTKRVSDKNINLYHPITKEASLEIEQAIINRFKEVMTKTDDRYHCSYDSR